MSFAPKESGHGLLEYILIIALVIVVLYAVYLTVRPLIPNIINYILPKITPSPTPTSGQGYDGCKFVYLVFLL
jgi:hypothetical protein